jgi:hypothetical protein
MAETEEKRSQVRSGGNGSIREGRQKKILGKVAWMSVVAACKMGQKSANKWSEMEPPTQTWWESETEAV